MEKKSCAIDDPCAVKTDTAGILPLVDQKVLNNKKWTFVFKRMVDVVGGSVGLVIASPIILGIAIAMKREEPNGPIIFSQTRIGKMANPSKCIKYVLCVLTQKQNWKPCWRKMKFKVQCSK